MSGVNVMKIKALAPWFGSKRNLAPKIVAELGSHRSYWEPFCGSMAVLLAKPESSMETVNDLHGDLVNLAHVIRDPVDGPKLYRRLRRVMMAKALHGEAAQCVREDWDGTDRVARAEAYFVSSWIGRSGVGGSRGYNFGYCIRYTANGGHAAERFNSAVRSIPAWRRRMRNVNILNEDAFPLLARIEDAPHTAIYVDPPYLVKGAKYVHDFEDDDHQRLADALRRFEQARIVISYYDHPRLDALYPGWTKRAFDVSKAMAHQGSRGSNDTRATEALLINGPSYTEANAPGLFAEGTASPIPTTPSKRGEA